MKNGAINAGYAEVFGYNVAGFRDRDFSKADFTAEGPYIKFRMKFDQGSAKEAVKSNSGQ